MNYGDITKRILEHLIEATADSIYLWVAIIECGYGASPRKIKRKMAELRSNSGRGSPRTENLQRRKRNFDSMLYKLERDGLIKRRRKRSSWLITQLGRERYKKIINRLPSKKYHEEADSNLKLIIFDIPEKQSEKREWLRDNLRKLGFRMIQKSVWAGKVKLPKEFIEDLRDLDLLPYIEILAVTKTGSLSPTFLK